MINSSATNLRVAEAFDKQSDCFDEIYSHNPIIAYKRTRTRASLEKYLKGKDKILELNAGTGEDAIYFAQKGYKIHATDLSIGMLSQLKNKVNTLNFGSSITTENVSFTDLENLANKGPYDAIFSNFGGLNCTDDLGNVLRTFSELTKPNGIIALVIMPPICFWEIFTFIKGNLNFSFRRLFAKSGAKAHIEGVHFKCWYYQPSYIIKYLKEDFTLVNIEGLCCLVPPSYFENFPIKHPQLFKRLIKLEDRLKNYFPFKYIGDYFIIVAKKNDNKI